MMKRSLRVFLISLFVSLSLTLPMTAAGAMRDIIVADRALNSTPLLGPEGIVLTPDGSAYVGERDGRIRRVTSDRAVEEFADLNTLPGEREERFGAVGLAMDRNGDIYAATLTALDGAVLKVVGPGKPDAGKVSMYRNGVNSANFVLIDNETGTMYVSDSSMFSGGVYRFDMNDESLVGTPADEEKELLGKFSYANGLALGPEKKWLYVAETLRGRVSRIDLATGKPEVFVEIGGWTDGLLLGPEGTRLFVCDNKGGRIVAVDFSGAIVGDARLVGKEGQTAPACMVFRDANTIVYTDLWKASFWGALFGNPERHSYIYEVSVNEIVQ
jgi:sugar lactone lactonase YvrE